MRRVAILSVGDELVLGQIEDTNASWIARELRGLGAMPGERRTVADDRGAIALAMRELADTHEALIVTGGLGPTLDDLTRDALAALVDPGAPLVEDPAGVEHLRNWFEKRGRAMPASNLRQAMRPRSLRPPSFIERAAPVLAVVLGGLTAVPLAAWIIWLTSGADPLGLVDFCAGWLWPRGE